MKKNEEKEKWRKEEEGIYFTLIFRRQEWEENKTNEKTQ